MQSVSGSFGEDLSTELAGQMLRLCMPVVHVLRAMVPVFGEVTAQLAGPTFHCSALLLGIVYGQGLHEG